MLPSIHIIYFNFLTPDGNRMSVGGIQTYISHLRSLLLNLGYNIIIYQISDVNFVKKINDSTIVGVKCKNKFKKSISLYKACMKLFDVSNDILIWASESLVVKSSDDIRSITIQHGIYWDIPILNNRSNIQKFIIYLKKMRHIFCTIKKINLSKNIVCVDHNFCNWYRSLPINVKSLNVIPNFTEIPTDDTHRNKYSNIIKIIFARRFWEYRGTRLFAKCINKVLKKHRNIDVTFAGEGPDEQWLKNKFSCFQNVHFIRYDSSESLKIHEDKHIAVIPSLGSEGTSLSLLEAMSSNCAVICTNVGGMTNIVVDYYNGLMIRPEEDDLYNALVTLIENEHLRNELASRGLETVKTGFSLEKWEERWKKLISEIMA